MPAASILIKTSSPAPTVDVTGKVLTFDLTGGTGTYSLSSGSVIDGLKVGMTADGGRVFDAMHILSSSFSGATATVTLDTAIPSGATVTTALDPTSNLTDSGANTATGQTGVSVTNSSTVALTAFASNDAAVAVVGMQYTPQGTYQSHAYASAQGAFPQWEFSYTGDLWMVVRTSAPGAANSCISLTLDGGSPTTLSASVDNLWVAIPLITDGGTHTVKVKGLVGFITDIQHTFYGPSTPTYPIGYGKIHNLWEVPSYISRGQGIGAPAGGTPVLITQFGYDAQIRFKTTSNVHTYKFTVVSGHDSGFTHNYSGLRLDPNGTLKIYGSISGGKFLVTTDNVEGSMVPMSNTGAYDWFTLATGLDGTVVDETATWATRRSIVFAGDSKVAAWHDVYGIDDPAGTTAVGYVHLLGAEHDWDVQNRGAPGTNDPGNADWIDASDNDADVIYIEWGVNAAFDDPATITAKRLATFTAARTRCPLSLIVQEIILPCGAGGTTDVSAARAAQHAAFVAFGDSNCIEIDISAGMIFPDDFEDGTLHQGPTGYVKNKNNAYPYLAGGPTVPGAPVLTSDNAEPSESGTNLTPTAPASNGGAAIIDYQLERNRNGAGFVLFHTLLAADLINGYLDTGTAIGDDVIYRVRCRNSVGYSPYSATQEVTSQGPLTGVVDSIELLFD